MKNSLILLGGLVFLAVSCAQTEPDLSPLTQEEISGSRLWERISQESDYTVYAQWPGHEGLRPGQAPHGVKHRVFANKPLYTAMPVDEAPEGTILVKENYNNADELVKLTVMAKVKGYNPEHNDWFWAAMDPDGTVTGEGRLEGCISCHSGMRSNDYVILQPLDERP